MRSLTDTVRTDLLLIDAPLSIPSHNLRDTTRKHTFPTLPNDPYNRPDWEGINPYEMLRRTLTNFPAREVMEFMTSETSSTGLKKTIFHCLLTVSDWQSIADDFEGDLRRLQSQATKSLEKKTLEALGAFRRTVATAREYIADNEAQMILATGMATLRSVGKQVSRRRNSCMSR